MPSRREATIHFERVSGLPMWYQIYLAVRDAIQRGDYRRGQPLEAIATVCEQFGVSPPTVRRAYAHLCQTGYVDPGSRTGNYVVRSQQGFSTSPDTTWLAVTWMSGDTSRPHEAG